MHWERPWQTPLLRSSQSAQAHQGRGVLQGPRPAPHRLPNPRKEGPRYLVDADFGLHILQALLQDGDEGGGRH